MAGLRFADLQSRPMEFLDFTSLTLDEFPQLVPPFDAAFQARMAAWRMDGKPRTARRFTVYQNCPLPTPEDRRFCRKVRFLGQNPKTECREFNDLQTAKLSKKQLCDRTATSADLADLTPSWL
jgi:hypothetical protein